MDEQASINDPNSQNFERSVEQARWADIQSFTRLLNMSPIPTPSEVPAVFPRNWQPGSSFGFFPHPNHGVMPQSPCIGPRNLPVRPSINQNIGYFQQLSESECLNVQPSQPPNQSKGKEPWTVDEDVEVCVAWLNISEDSITGTGQRQAAFWKRVVDQFASQMKEKYQKVSSRSKDAVIARWGAIHPAVTKWSALHATLTRTLPSGWSVEQVESSVRAMYQSKYKELFKFEKCWKVLRDSYKWQSWVKERNDAARGGSLHNNNSQPASEPITQQDTISVHEESETQSTPNNGTSPPIQPAIDKEQNPLLTGPASKDKPRPPGVKKAKNQRQRNKQQFIAEQIVGSDKISAALVNVDARVEERSRRQDELKRRRDEILDERYEEHKRMTEKEHTLNVATKRTQLAKDILFLTDQLVAAYKYLHAADPSSLMTPGERYEYEAKRKCVRTLEAQLTEKQMVMDTTAIQSPEVRAPTSQDSTPEITPCRSDGEGWTTDLAD